MIPASSFSCSIPNSIPLINRLVNVIVVLDAVVMEAVVATQCNVKFAELSQLSDIVVEPLRDRIVTILLQTSLDGLLHVILGGGPSRVFFLGDAKLLEEDLERLKDRLSYSSQFNATYNLQQSNEIFGFFVPIFQSTIIPHKVCNNLYYFADPRVD
ncbi:plant/MOJ9-14 protein [Spatholobus suberectus]|nr:plant/MOJ9-14 protein [Spatholobus suberectus]